MAVQFCIPVSNEWEFLLLHILISIWCCSVLDFGHKCVVGSHCCFYLHFLITFNVEHLYIGLFAICTFSLVRYLLRSLVRFLNQVICFLILSFKNSLHVLDNTPLIHESFANIFSQSMACLLILLTLSFTDQKLLTLMKSGLSILSFMDHAFVVISKHLSPYPRPSRFSPMSSSQSFIVLCFTFRSMIHFELNFMKDVRSVSIFTWM